MKMVSFRRRAKSAPTSGSGATRLAIWKSRPYLRLVCGEGDCVSGHQFCRVLFSEQKNIRGRASMAIIFLSRIFLSFWLRPKAALGSLWLTATGIGAKTISHEGHKGKVIHRFLGFPQIVGAFTIQIYGSHLVVSHRRPRCVMELFVVVFFSQDPRRSLRFNSLVGRAGTAHLTPASSRRPPANVRARRT